MRIWFVGLSSPELHMARVRSRVARGGHDIPEEKLRVGNLLETTGHGAWTRTGGDTFEVFFRFMLQDADSGAPVGTDNVRLFLTFDRGSQTLTGTSVSQIKDNAGNVLLQVGGTYSATPIAVQN